MGLANLFFPILDIEPRLFQPIEQKGGVGLHVPQRRHHGRKTHALVSALCYFPKSCGELERYIRWNFRLPVARGRVLIAKLRF